MEFECRKMSRSQVHAGTGSSRCLSLSIDAYDFFFPFENQTRSSEICCGRSKLQKQVHKGYSSSASSPSSSSYSSSYRFVITRARCSVARLFQRIRTSVSRAQHSIPRRKSRSQPTSPYASMTKQIRGVRFVDCHHAEAIEDCIKFLKNSSRNEESLNTSPCQLQHPLQIQLP